METANGSKNGRPTNGFRYRFDDFEIDPANRLLLRAGVAVPLTAKVFDLLLIFTENPGQLLSKDELIEKLWHESFVEDGNLARNISTLRKALGDAGKQHRFISTIPGHGYRFVADVVPVTKNGHYRTASPDAADENGSGVSISKTASESKLPRYRERLAERILLVMIALLGLAGVTAVALRVSKPGVRQIDRFSFEHMRQTRLTQEGDSFRGGQISPDGRYLLFNRVAGGESSLCVRQIATGSDLELRRLPPGKGLWGAAFAPDESFLYYILEEADEDHGSLYRVPLLGGRSVKIADRVDGGITVSPDGSRVGFVRNDRTAGVASVLVADANGTNERPVRTAKLDSAFGSLTWSPDGERLTYSFADRAGDRYSYYLAEVPAIGGEERRIGGNSSTPILSEQWLSDQSGLIVNAIDETSRLPQLYAVSYPDGASRRLTNNQSSFRGFSMTADGLTAVVPQLVSNRQLWIIGDGRYEKPAEILGGKERHFDSIAWANDEYLVYDEDTNSSFDKFNIYRARRDGTEIEQLTNGPGNNRQPAVSPDGSIVAFVSDRSGTSQLWKMNIDGRGLVRLTGVPGNVLRPAFAQHGETIYFSAYSSGKANLWQVPSAGGTPSLVISDQVSEWAVSPDGKTVAFSNFDAEARAVRTRVRSLQGTEPDIVFDISPETWLDWAVDGKSLLYNTGGDGVHNIWRQPLDGSKPQRATNLTDEQIYRFAWTANGKTLACIRHTTSFDAAILHFE